jgi:hypothetical protein
MRMEAGRTEVLGICRRQHHEQICWRRLCPFRRRLKALIREQAASSRICLSSFSLDAGFPMKKGHIPQAEFNGYSGRSSPTKIETRRDFRASIFEFRPLLPRHS